ncbi:MAG TPA: M48 family metalloprotease [Spirochaetota bacterium]|nr:M48 family metalloprotease [Spirochaetota bacterium]HOL57247.1 M48 family metalloprotease [Spirochaetota bacterium]HPP03519.1 M48 family metalloprotease [Spirochaetota bacterium]
MKKVIFFLKFLVLFLIINASCKSFEEYQKNQKLEREREIVEKEIEVGKSVFAKLAGKYGIIKNKEATEYLNKIGKSLALYCERVEIEYFFAILNSESINAYALPGGYILISIGTLKNVNSEAELLGIIAHELGHINKKHILKNVKIEVRPNFFEILARFLAGPRNVVTVAINQISNKIEETLFIKGLDKDDEYEADSYAVNLLKLWNIEQKSYVEFLKRLNNNEDTKKMQELYATHPDFNSRIDKLNQIIDNNSKSKRDSDEFIKFKNIINNL